MTFNTPPFIHLGIDVRTGKSYHICSRKSLLSFGAILLLIVAMASERFLFKVMVDRMESYRYFLCQLMTFLYIPPMFCIVSYKAAHEDSVDDDGMEFPKFHFMVMGVLDMLHGMMLFIAGGRTDPTQTLLLMQASIPLSACMSALFVGVRYTRPQIVGMLAITGGLVVSLLPSVEDTLVGFLASFVVVAWYQVDPDNFGMVNLHDGLRNWIPPSVFVDVFAFLIIFAGKVLYQWDPDPEVEATTLSAEDKEAMSLLSEEDDYGLRYT
ncbi:hypothetical protein G195_008707 [Phytophthora kernoviae 00238/432]|uniref:Uncharacterized protein n=1 Tax=Phytophthora kernoviae 00238/432 TaxID=1284355 RepID=A0A8J4SCB2_9STRA|nr:hypothetical protein G195_008707 [Phytophthora kernoviae 00238/432]